MQPPSPASPDPEPEPDELVRFREQWKQELHQRRLQELQAKQPQLQNPPDPPTSQRAEGAPNGKLFPVAGLASQKLARPAGPAVQPTAPSSHGTSQDLSPTLRKAVRIYREAVAHEQRSELDAALQLYRQAFRLDRNVDRAYRKEELQRQATEVLSATAAATSPDITIAQVDLKAPLGKEVKKKDDPPKHQSVYATLARIVDSISVSSAELAFEPEDERSPVQLEKLPDEILIHFLRMLDYTSVERFATVCKKARILTLDSSIWRDFVHAAYKHSPLLQGGSLDDLVDRYAADYRRLYIEHPRVRLDGVYIAVCHYIRAGQSENAWVNVSHLITYHRYLRFLPDGQVLSLLANDEMPPAQIIPLLKPSLRMKGLFIGTWELLDTSVIISQLFDASGNTAPSRYSFQMQLALQSRPLGRWNRLDLQAYESVDFGANGPGGDIEPEVQSLPLKHQRPFWFSKVRSWAT